MEQCYPVRDGLITKRTVVRQNVEKGAGTKALHEDIEIDGARFRHLLENEGKGEIRRPF